MNSVPRPPVTFNLRAHENQWFHWCDIESCFWPGYGRRSHQINPTLCTAKNVGGVYVLAWSRRAPKEIHPTNSSVQYVGETGLFLRRMDQFGTSAGFWGSRAKGHSAGWRWPKGRTENLWVAFFEVGHDLRHLACGMRRWMEAIGLEEYRQHYDVLPPLNRAEDGELASRTLRQ